MLITDNIEQLLGSPSGAYHVEHRVKLFEELPRTVDKSLVLWLVVTSQFVGSLPSAFLMIHVMRTFIKLTFRWIFYCINHHHRHNINCHHEGTPMAKMLRFLSIFQQTEQQKWCQSEIVIIKWDFIICCCFLMNN